MVPNPMLGLIVLRVIASAVHIFYGYHGKEALFKFTGLCLVSLDSLILIVACLIP